MLLLIVGFQKEKCHAEAQRRRGGMEIELRFHGDDLNDAAARTKGHSEKAKVNKEVSHKDTETQSF